MAILTQALFDQICLRIEHGETLSECCRDLCIIKSAVWRWCDKSEEAAGSYARAREKQAESWADKLLEIAEDSEKDTQIGPNGILRENREWTSRSKLKFETYKWLMSKNHVGKYGDKVEQKVVGADGGVLVFKWLDGSGAKD